MDRFKTKNHVLVVDDTPANLTLLKTILTYHGYDVTPIQNGNEAIERVLELSPDIILLDVSMPEVDGYDVCESLKINDETRDIPVIFMSALDDTDDKLKAFAMGGVDYITKPFQIDEILARINTHLTIRQLQRDLEQQVAELKAFTSTVAHDIKSPIAVANGFAEQMALYRDEFSVEEQQRFLNAIFSSTKKAANIVDELLMLAQISQGEVPVESLNMAEIMGEVKLRVATYLNEYGGNVSYPDQWPVATGYAPWVEEVWVNYISNGLKYGGDEANVTVGVTELADNRIKFWVRDQGPGLTEEDQTQLFIEFTRVHSSAKNRKGHGLGLSIVKRIIEKLGGTVGVESEVGVGSCFYFVLPADR